MKCRGSGKVRVCSAGGRTFTLHAGRSNKAAKKSRARKLRSNILKGSKPIYRCARDKKGRFRRPCRKIG